MKDADMLEEIVDDFRQKAIANPSTVTIDYRHYLWLTAKVQEKIDKEEGTL